MSSQMFHLTDDAWLPSLKLRIKPIKSARNWFREECWNQSTVKEKTKFFLDDQWRKCVEAFYYLLAWWFQSQSQSEIHHTRWILLNQDDDNDSKPEFGFQELPTYRSWSKKTTWNQWGPTWSWKFYLKLVKSLLRLTRSLLESKRSNFPICKLDPKEEKARNSPKGLSRVFFKRSW